MSRLRLSFASILVIIVNCDAGKKHYHKSQEDNVPIPEAFSKVLVGSTNFFRSNVDALNCEIKDTTPIFNQEYDFIVIGAGSAGSTVASRLSELVDNTVLLIEAGSSENLFMDIPVFVNYLQFNRNINWNYETEPLKNACWGLNGKKSKWPRGKVMGGSSVLNYMIATRGNPLDYDEWAKIGNKGWSYNELLKYFKKLENIGIPEYRKNTEAHNLNRPVYIDYIPYRTPLVESYIQAGLEIGYPTIDYNDDQFVGFSYIQSTIKNGTRVSTNKAYLYPANKRKNLFVSKLSHVNKLLINSKTKRAYGVDFTKFNKNIHVKARKEIILCAGTIGSAQILMLSGIGPTEHLKDMRINTIQDAPVGENLMDHIAYGGLIFIIDQPVSLRTDVLIQPTKPYLSDFLIKRSGPFTVPGGCEALAFIDVDKPNKLDVYPNIELLFISSSILQDYFLRYNFGITDEYWNKMYLNHTNNFSWMIFPILMRPNSKGKIVLRNKNPNTKPKIFPNYLNDTEDLRIMIKGIRAAIQISKTKAMQKYKSRLIDIPVINCEQFNYDSDEYWECAIRTFTYTIYHHSGTCKMASENDPTGVVNSRLQVKGIQGLRVADASIMPTIITGHTNIPVIMIGEKLADLVKEDWGYKTDSRIN